MNGAQYSHNDFLKDLIEYAVEGKILNKNHSLYYLVTEEGSIIDRREGYVYLEMRGLQNPEVSHSVRSPEDAVAHLKSVLDWAVKLFP